MPGTILVPLDVNVDKTTSEALALASEIAKARGSKINLLHVVERMPGYITPHLPDDFRNTSLKTAADDLKAAATAHGLNGGTELTVREGNPSAEILDYAKNCGAEMIVMASHDPGMADYLLGSNAARVVRHAHCSVLVVRHPKA